MSYKPEKTALPQLFAKCLVPIAAPCQPLELPMLAWFAPLKIFSLIVVLLMVAAMVYAGTMAIVYWSGISV